jgi:hypothetical protein
VRPDILIFLVSGIRQVTSGIQPDTGYKKGRIIRCIPSLNQDKQNICTTCKDFLQYFEETDVKEFCSYSHKNRLENRQESLVSWIFCTKDFVGLLSFIHQTL